MNPQNHDDIPLALDLKDACVLLARDGSMNAYTKTAAAMMNARNDSALRDGSMLALYRVNDSEDVHYPAWEMHPEGDELLLIADGSISVELRDGKTSRLTRLPTHAAFVVPAMTWHRLIVHEPSVLVVITPRHDTVHEH